MADVTLHDGREIDIDEFAITHGEFANILARITTDAEDEIIFGKAAGLTPAQIAELPEKDWRALSAAIVKKVTTPDPN